MAQLSFDASSVKPYNAPEPTVEPKRTYSKYQQNIFDFVEHGDGNAIVVAVAGSGKSTTIVEANKRVRGSSIFLAFNKSIAEELKQRGINARTFHSVCYGPVLKARGVQSVTADKVVTILRQQMDNEQREKYMNFVVKLIGLGRQLGIGAILPDDPKLWWNLAEHHDLHPDQDAPSAFSAAEEDAYIAEGCQLASDMLFECNKAAMIDFDDMLYLAVKENISLPKYDFIFVDEAQDTNPIQREILRKMSKPNTRIIAVGDPSQAIYGFRGADSQSMGLLQEEFNCKELPLSISYRCAASVVKYAQQWVSHIEPSDTAPEGIVGTVAEWNCNSFSAGDLVVCRTTAPLMSLAYKMLRNHKPVTVLGREIGAGIKSLINKLQARGIDAMLEKLDKWETRELAKLKSEQEQKRAAITDKADTVRILATGLQENERTIPSLLRVIDSLFTDKAGATILCTIHKSKGLESNRVWWLNRKDCPAKWVTKDWQYQQEINLCYVATTRAKSELYFIELSGEN